MLRLTWVFGLALFSIAIAAGSAEAGFFQGYITADFENPVLIGSTIRPNGVGDTQFDNTSSAFYKTYPGAENNAVTFQWGSSSTGAPGFSLLNFFPNQNVQVSNGTPFSFGTITYYNGTSDLNSLVFGVNLVLSFHGSPSVDTMTIPITIGTTNNVGDAAANADFITVQGVNLSFFALEGLGATADLIGTIVGDPQFNPQTLLLQDGTFTVYQGPDTPGPYDPSQFSTFTGTTLTGGFLAPALTPAPEPGSLVLLAMGGASFAGVFAVRRSRKRSHQPA